MIAYHNNPAIKEKYLNRVLADQKADRIIKGTYGRESNGGWRGCAVGCTMRVADGNEHAQYPIQIGVPEVIARIEDSIFEGLPVGVAPQFVIDFLEAIPVGADLSLVASKWFVWLLTDPIQGVLRLAKREETKTAIQNVSDLYQRQANGETVEKQEFSAAAAAAAAAAADAAAAAADAADAAAAAAAAADAAAAAAAADARRVARLQQRDKLLELLRDAPVK